MAKTQDNAQKKRLVTTESGGYQQAKDVVDTQALKSGVSQEAWGFDSPSRHSNQELTVSNDSSQKQNVGIRSECEECYALDAVLYGDVVVLCPRHAMVDELAEELQGWHETLCSGEDCLICPLLDRYREVSR